MNVFLDAMFAETHGTRMRDLGERVEEEKMAFHIRCFQSGILPPEKTETDSIGGGIALGCFWLGLFWFLSSV